MAYRKRSSGRGSYANRSTGRRSYSSAARRRAPVRRSSASAGQRTVRIVIEQAPANAAARPADLIGAQQALPAARKARF